jgi:hypothetical protein
LLEGNTKRAFSLVENTLYRRKKKISNGGFFPAVVEVYPTRVFSFFDGRDDAAHQIKDVPIFFSTNSAGDVLLDLFFSRVLPTVLHVFATGGSLFLVVRCVKAVFLLIVQLPLFLVGTQIKFVPDSSSSPPVHS